MTIILYLVAASVGIGTGGLCLFLWALRDGQFEDLEGAASRVLFDDSESLGQDTTSSPRA